MEQFGIGLIVPSHIGLGTISVFKGLVKKQHLSPQIWTL